MYNKRVIDDKLNVTDRYIKDTKKSTLWAGGTSIQGGYGLKRDPLTGVTSFDERMFNVTNTVTIGGVQYAMEQLFGDTGSITIPTLYDQEGIGLPNTGGGSTVPIPGGSRSMPYKYGNTVCLYGVGITNSAQNTISKYPVPYRQNSIAGTYTDPDGTALTGIMLPFRYTSDPLSDTEVLQYFGKKSEDGGYTGYYLKRFENDPIIKHLWDTGTGDESEEEVTNAEVWTSTRTTNVISVTEIELKIASKDIKEFFNVTGRVDEPAVNTIALYFADYNSTLGDYENVRMFSKLYIPTEPLSLSKDLDLLYKVYGS